MKVRMRSKRYWDVTQKFTEHKENKMHSFDLIKQQIEAAQADSDKFFIKGNKTAGVRLRKALLEIRNTAHAGRLDIADKIR